MRRDSWREDQDLFKTYSREAEVHLRAVMWSMRRTLLDCLEGEAGIQLDEMIGQTTASGTSILQGGALIRRSRSTGADLPFWQAPLAALGSPATTRILTTKWERIRKLSL